MLLVAVAGAIGVYPLLSTVAARGSSGALVVANPIGKPQLLSVSDAQGELVSEQASRIARFGIPRARILPYPTSHRFSLYSPSGVCSAATC